MEVKQEVKVFTIDYICDDCGIGKMIATGVCFPTYPPRYQHACDHCGQYQTFNKTYPYQEYQKKQN